MNKIKRDYKVKVTLASPEEIKGWASGRITASETLNYRTLKPVHNGLFCARIFGPTVDYECLCRRYKGYKYDGVICDKCGVQVTSSSIRRSRMGYIDLIVPVVHPWFFRNNNKISLLIDIALKDLKKIANLEKYIVFEAKNMPFKPGDIISLQEYNHHVFDDDFRAETGATALKELLEKVDFNEKIAKANEILSKNPSVLVKKKYRMLLELCEGMKESGVRPEWMILTRIAVIPPDLRPLLEIEGGKFISSDINELYRKVIYRANRLSSLIENRVTIPLIFHNEIRILQDGINRLFGYGGETEAKDSTKKYKSLEEKIKGKEGSFRKFMLGKREDFSGRSVIVVDPSLKLDECTIPKEMALEILKPSVIGYLRLYGLASSIKQAKRIIEAKKPEVWDVLNEIINTRFPVTLLNRAPTLHRVGIMAFRVKLWSKKCIGIHPLVCQAFNADFDGDQMAIHWPLSEEAKAEAWELMRPSSNLGSATNGNLIVGVFRDIALGIHFLSLTNEVDSGKYATSFANLEWMLATNIVSVNDYISFLVEHNGEMKVHKTTPGRVLIWKILPKHKELPFEILNKELVAKDAHDIMKKVRLLCGNNTLSQFSDDMKDLGFKYGNFNTGSIGKDDLFEIPGAKDLVQGAIKKQINFNMLFEDGLITFNEMETKSDDLWKSVQAKGKELLELSIKDQKFNPLVTVTRSGARGSTSQMLQILFIKGTVLDISGKFSMIPIWNCHRDGLTMDQYFLLSYGGRKGVADVAFKTAESGYLTRRLVEVAHDVVINAIDCETKNYIIAKNIFRDGVLQSMVHEKILKRVTALDIRSPSTGKILVPSGTLIDERIVELLKSNEVTEVPIRSPALCDLPIGVCANCYGGDLSSINSLVCLGEAVGIIAAQSIGEPGTQLTMRSFHSGGVASFGFMETGAKTPFVGFIEYNHQRIIQNLEGQNINISRDFKIYVKNKYGLILADFSIPYGARILVEDRSSVEENAFLAKWSQNSPIIAEEDGVCKFLNLQVGLNCEEITDSKGERRLNVVPHKQLPFLILKTKDGLERSYFLAANTILEVSDGMKVKAGMTLAYTVTKTNKIDIVGGLQKVVNILENRPPNQISILSKWNGTVSIHGDKKGKGLLIIKDEKNQEHEVYTGDGILSVQNGQIIKKGDMLTNGIPLMQDILDTRGIDHLIEVFLKELQNIYFNDHGLKINDKHFEVILQKMCKHYEINDGKVVEKHKMNEINEKLSSKHKQQIEGRRLINGITHSALDSAAFLASASFQETINIVTLSGLIGAEDVLRSIKSCIIAGTLIPAGTGFAYDVFNQLSQDLLTESETEEVKVET